MTSDISPIATNEPPALVELQSIYKVYRHGSKNAVPAINGLNFTVRNGDFFAIQGASGSGKSTLLNLIGFLDTPTEGSYDFEGKDVRKLKDPAMSRLRNKRIGFIFQDFALLPDETAQFNVGLPLRFTRATSADIKDKAHRALKDVGLEDKLNEKVRDLSGGQKQRVAIARALVIEPVLLLADEPTGALDSVTGQEIMSLLKELNQSAGLTIICVTHDDAVASVANTRKFMKDGRFTEEPVR